MRLDMKFKNLLLLIVFFVFPYQLYADTIGVQLGAGVWSHSATGYVSDSADTIDLKSDLNLEDKQEGYFYIAVEHPLPIIPNIRFASTKLSHAGNGIITSSKTFGGVTYNLNEAVSSTIILDSTDITIYYEILDNVVELDFGLTARKLDGKIRIVGASTGVGEQTINETVPLVYLAVGVHLPAGLTLNAEINAVSVGGVSYSDFLVKLRYGFIDMFGVEGGVRTQKLTLKNIDNLDADISFSGLFVGAYLHF